MKKVLWLLPLLLLGPAQAQVVTPPNAVALVCANNTVVPTPTNGQFFYVQCDGNGKLLTTSSGSAGTVTSVAVATQNGVSAVVTNPTTTPSLAFTLGAITPSTVAIGAGSPITSSGPGGALTALSFTAPGTGVVTALGVNIGSTGAPVLLNGAGGTPSSMVGTNITGTAAGLTAGGVTTNANLTGDVTSSGNATTLAAGSASNLNSGTLAAARGGAGTVNGALKANGSGAVSQAGCADLSGGCVTTSAVLNTTYNLATASGTQVLSGFGFTPSSCVAFGSTQGLGTSQTVFNAHVDSARNQANLSEYNGTVNQSTTSFFNVYDATAINYQLGTVSAFGSGTVTITWVKTGSPTGTFSFSIRCFK